LKIENSTPLSYHPSHRQSLSPIPAYQRLLFPVIIRAAHIVAVARTFFAFGTLFAQELDVKAQAF